MCQLCCCIAKTMEKKTSAKLIKVTSIFPLGLARSGDSSFTTRPLLHIINVQKHLFIHLLMATFKVLHIENSKNYKR